MPAMPIEVIETAKGWTIRAELAGVAKDQIDIQIESGSVVISARRERKQELKDGERLLRSEISSGAVTRSFSMPAEIDEAAASARFEDGLLTLELPRKQAQTARKLAVH
jgi:HSP20 family protein